MSYTEKAQRGANLLDRRRPGWHREIDRETLNQGDTRCCIGGQLYGSYSELKSALGLSYEESVEHGFEIRDESPETVHTSPTWEYQDLTAAMLREVNLRVAADELLEEAQKELELEMV